ncbi:unnamed protein product [Meloidogyne enterolobii]|uniref:Uncharacterized protein n=1 Tax=Meloidogyne enterolobii TaxID=390850 RepID=A0ACB1B5X7_MELEN
MAAMEFDFEEADLQAKAHPGINSGDLVKNIILIGKDEELNGCKEGKECKDKKAKSKQNRRYAPRNEEKWEIINKMSDDINSKKGSRIEKYGRKSVGNKKRAEGEVGEEREGEELNLVKNNHDQGLLNSIHSETIEATPTGHILDQLIIFHPNDGKRSRESQIISQMLLPDGGFHGKVTGDGKIEHRPADDDWVLPEVETQTVSTDRINSSSNSSHSSTPLSIFPAPDFSIIKPGDQVPPQKIIQRLEEERKRIDSGYKFADRVN